MAAPNFVTVLPANIQTALDNILNSVPGSDVRMAIITVLTWGMNNAFTIGDFVNDLGLMVHDGKLCYTNEDVVPSYNGIPSEISSLLNRIQHAKYGRDTRQAIVKALKWGGDYVSLVAGFIDDLGLTVKDGKLCVVYRDGEPSADAAYQESYYAGPGIDPDPNGYKYYGINDLR